MATVSIAVEGTSDVAAAKKILASRSVHVDPKRIFITHGKVKFDKKIASYDNAAANSQWFMLRDSDRDKGDCAVTLRESLLSSARQNQALCLRLAVRSLEAWLLADAEAFAKTFSVAHSIIPHDVESLLDPKRSLVDLCRQSRRADVRKAMTPPKGSTGNVGPEYVTWIGNYAADAWRPEVAAVNSPSLARALQAIDDLLSSGAWS